MPVFPSPPLATESIPAGEDLSGILSVCLASGRYVALRALPGSGFRMPAIGVTTENVVSGEEVTVATEGWYIPDNSGINVTWSGKEFSALYVGSGGVPVLTSPSDGQRQQVAYTKSGSMYVMAGVIPPGTETVILTSGVVRSGHLGVTGTPDGTKFLLDNFTWSSPGAASVGSGDIGSGKVASGAVQGVLGSTRHIVAGTVGTSDLGSGIVTSGKLGVTQTPDGSKFLRDDFSWQAAGGGLTSGAVQSGHIGNNAVVSGSIASGQIFWMHTTGIVSGLVLSGGLGSGIIGGVHLADGAVSSGDIASGQVSLFHLADNAVRSGHIASGIIGAVHLADGAVGSGDITAAIIASPHLASGAVTSGKLGVTGTPDGTKVLRDDFSWVAPSAPSIGSGDVGSGKVASGAVQGFFGATRHVASGTLGSFDFGSGAVTAGILGSGAVVSGNVASGQIGLYHLTTSLVSGLVLSGGLGSGIVGSVHLGDGAVTSGDIASGIIGAVHLADGSVASGEIAAAIIASPHLASGAVTSGKLAVTQTPDGSKFLRDDFSWQAAGAGLTSGAVQSGHIGNAAVVSGSVASGSLAGVHIANAGVGSGSIASGSISNFHHAANSVLSGHVASGVVRAAINYVIDGGGTALASGHKGFVQIPWNCNLESLALFSDASGGSVFLGIWRDSFGNFQPTSGDTISVSGQPLISGSMRRLYSGTGDLSTWTTAYTRGDVIGFVVHSGATMTRVTISMQVGVT